MEAVSVLGKIYFKVAVVTVLSIARLMAFFVAAPILTKQLISGYLRGALAITLSLIVIPLVSQQYPAEDVTWALGLSVLAKEILIGFMLGFALGLIIWIAHGMGFMIDNQRGASIAATFLALIEDEGTPLSSLAVMALLALMFISGAFLALISFLFETYRLWPVFSFFPVLASNGYKFFLQQLDGYMAWIALLAAPVMIACFVSEFGLGIMNRFAPQLNVFFLAMPIKSAVALAVLILYVPFLFNYFKEKFNYADVFLKPFKALLQ